MATLSYMPTEHVAVLASELIDLLDPRPGQTAVDCTFGGGGHARLVAERLGPPGRWSASIATPRPRSASTSSRPRSTASCVSCTPTSRKA